MFYDIYECGKDDICEVEGIYEDGPGVVSQRRYLNGSIVV